MNDLLVRGADHLWTGLRGAAMRWTGGTDLRVRGGFIEAIGELQPEPGERVVDARGCVVYPGWVNTHHHLFQSLLKGIPAGINLPLLGWLDAVPLPYRRWFDREEVLRVAARIGLVELMLSGCTTVADHQYHDHPGLGYDPSAAVFDEAERLGVRLVLCRGGQTVPRPLPDGSTPPWAAAQTLQQFMDAVARDVQRFHDPGPAAMRRVVSAITTPSWSCLPQELPLLAQQARQLGIRLHSHLSETHDYVRWASQAHGCSPLQFVADHGWVGPDVWFAHMVHLNDEELQLCARTGTGIAHCPQSNARLGSGIARMPRALALGVPVSLAVDGAASNEAADMISEAHACWLLHRADPRSGTAQPGGDAHAMTVEDVVHIGTAGGAQVLGLPQIGTLAPGQAADLAVYALDQPRHFGLHDPAIAPVASGGRPRLRALLVHGRVVVEDDGIPGLDLQGLRAQARALVAMMRPA
jgi:cytosine/adenosine deaminase-related metal-dependent hydrolase